MLSNTTRHHSITLSILLTSLFTSSSVYALVPPDYQEPPSDFSAEIEAGFQLNSGNTSSSSFNGRMKFVYETDAVKQELILRGYHAADSEKTTAERYDLQAQSSYKLNTGYIFGRGDFTLDKFGSFTKVSTLSTGYGFDAISNTSSKLSIEIGPGYRYNLPISDATLPDPEPNTELIARTAAKFEQKLQEYTSLNADLTSELGEDNNTLALDLSYKNTLFQDWAFKIGVNIKYTKIVPEGTVNTDTITTFNLLYTYQ